MSKFANLFKTSPDGQGMPDSFNEESRKKHWSDREMALTAVAQGADYLLLGRKIPVDEDHWESFGEGLNLLKKAGPDLLHARQDRRVEDAVGQRLPGAHLDALAPGLAVLAREPADAVVHAARGVPLSSHLYPEVSLQLLCLIPHLDQGGMPVGDES